MSRLAIATSFLLLVAPSCTADDREERINRELAAVLKWEVLWGGLPDGFHLPAGGAARLAVRLADGTVSYCSHDLGICESYGVSDTRNWPELASGQCTGGMSDRDSLRAFSPRPQMVTVGPQGPPASSGSAIAGLPTPRSGQPAAGLDLIWSATVSLGSRSDIVQQYRRLRPVELAGLRSWITKQSGVHGSEVTIACFAPTDPEVYLSITTPPLGHEIEILFWNKLAQTWQSATGNGPPVDPESVEDMFKIVESIPCARITF
jgi:hypothetical protein